ncbi:hypothetical protein ACHAO8_007419 [Botrytis cinerea]
MGHNYLVPQLCEELCGTRAYVHKFLRNGFNQKVINAWRIEKLQLAVEEGETGETGRSLRLACGSVTADQASQISTKEVIYPYDGPLDTGLIGLEFISDGPLAVEPIEWELMDSRVQEFDHSQLLKAEVEKYPKGILHIQQNTKRTNAT